MVVVDHPLHGFTDAAGQGYRTVISRIAVILAWFGNGYYCGFLPGGRDLTGLPDLVARSCQARSRTSDDSDRCFKN